MNRINANIYGDSVMKGTVIDEELKSRTVMENTLEKIEANHGVIASNRSKFGITVNMGDKILERDIRKGIDIDYALIEFGGNDCNYRWEEVCTEPDNHHTPLTPLNEFKKTYEAMINKLKKRGIKPIGMSLPPIDAEKYFNFIVSKGNDMKNLLKWLGDVNMLYRFHEQYSNAAAAIAKKTDILFVDVREYFLDKHNFKDLICLDGIHPNERGHRLIFDAFDEFIDSNL